MNSEKYNILEDPEQPKIGDEIQGRKSMFDFFGPSFIVVKVQALEFENGKMWKRPQNEEFPNGFMPDKEGCDELIMKSHTKRDGVHWLCWVNLKKFDVDSFLKELYEMDQSKNNAVKVCTKINETMDIGPQYQIWEELFEKVDVDKLKTSDFPAFLVCSKSYRKNISNFNVFIDKVIESCVKKNPEETPEHFEDLFGRWRYKPNKD